MASLGRLGGPASFAALVFALAFGAAATAQEARKFGEADTARVTAVDAEAGRIVVETPDGPQVFGVEPVTRIVRGGDPIDLGSVNVGDRIVVDARDEPADDSERLIADRILIVVDEEAPATDTGE